MSPAGRGTTADLLLGVTELCASRNPEELARAGAALAAHWVPSESVQVVLEGADGDVGALAGRPSEALAAWTAELRRAGGKARIAERDGQLAAMIDGRGEEARGVLAVALSQPLGDDERRSLAALAHFIGACAAQQEEARRSSRALEDAKRSLGKGLHDLRTPLNSLRLGLHLLEPALVTQDATIVQRTHRAVDRMTALITEMAEVLHGAPSAGTSR